MMDMRLVSMTCSLHMIRGLVELCTWIESCRSTQHVTHVYGYIATSVFNVGSLPIKAIAG